MTETVKVYNPNDGITGRDGGPYLDIEEAKAREARSAQREGRTVNKNETPRGIGIPEKTERDILDRRYIPGSLGGDVLQDVMAGTDHGYSSLDLDEDDDKTETKTSSSGTKDK